MTRSKDRKVAESIVVIVDEDVDDGKETSEGETNLRL